MILREVRYHTGMEPENFPPISEQDRNNAFVCYFFMSYLILLSPSENFKHPFIRAHAKYAAFFHSIIGLVLLISFGLNMFSRSAGDIGKGVIGIGLIQILSTILFLVCFLGILYGLIQASKNKTPSLKTFFRFKKDFNKNREHIQTFAQVSEWEIGMIMLSYVPFLGLWIAKYNKHLPETAIGARAGSIAACIFFLVSLQLSVGQNSLLMGMALIYIVAVFIRGAILYIQKDEEKEIYIPLFLPSLAVVYAYIRSIPELIKRFIQTASGKRSEIRVAEVLLQRQIQDEKEEQLYLASSKQETFPFAPAIVYMPAISLVFLLRLIGNKRDIFRRPIVQSNVLFLLLFILW